MKVCTRCSREFNNYAKVDGKVHNIHNRTICLKCQPLGSVHGGSKVNRKTGTYLTCERCGKEYFYNRKDRGGHNTKTCNTCSVTKRRIKVKAILVAEAGGKCRRCGYDKCLAALVFHHRNPKKKEFGLGFRGIRRGIKALRKEARKCTLLCQNCHTEVHAEIIIGHLAQRVRARSS
jgi:hypothetical protein